MFLHFYSRAIFREYFSWEANHSSPAKNDYLKGEAMKIKYTNNKTRKFDYLNSSVQFREKTV